jgi:hypothetical protein
MAARFKQQPDPRGGHIRLYWSLFDSAAWRVLTHADVRVYLAMRRKLGKTNNGDIGATLAEMKHAGIKSSSTLAAALSRLQALGFIAQTRRGGIASGGKVCSLYRFTDEPTLDVCFRDNGGQMRLCAYSGRDRHRPAHRMGFRGGLLRNAQGPTECIVSDKPLLPLSIGT